MKKFLAIVMAAIMILSVTTWICSSSISRRSTILCVELYFVVASTLRIDLSTALSRIAITLSVSSTEILCPGLGESVNSKILTL